MANSEAYTRIRRDVLAMVASIPRGRVSTYRSLGEFFDIMPRHVAYILASLPEAERDSVPWHRVVGEGGKISRADSARAAKQVEQLMAEGLEVDTARHVLDFAAGFVAADALVSGVLRQRREA